MTERPRILTTSTLKKLGFVFSMHLNRGREHDIVYWNAEWRVSVCVTSQRTMLIRKRLYAVGRDAGELDLLERNEAIRADLFARFCDRYNFAEETAREDPDLV